MQKTINLPHYKKSPFDLRVLCQKNGSGKWSVTGIGIRHASPESITTHVPHGGKVQDPKMVMENVFGAVQSKELLKNAEITALKLAKGIETESRKLIGEMSMDLGVDRNGKIWFFEANAKPMKFDEPHIQKKSMSQILNFCAYLTC